ncbi:calcium-transporting ATPase 1 [Diutina catenulata]
MADESIYSDDLEKKDSQVIDERVHVGITFKDEDTRGRKRTRRLSIHSRERPTSLSRDRVRPELVLPAAFKTVSHRVDNELDAPPAEQQSKFAKCTFHTDSVASLEKRFCTSVPFGLSDFQCKASSEKFGPNLQSKPPSRWWKKTFVYFFGGFGLLLLSGGVLCIIAWKPLGDPPSIANLVLGIILLVVFVAQALFNFFQDFSTSRVMKSIHDLIPAECFVVRDGQAVSMDSKSLVPGDIVRIVAGNKVPADVRIAVATPDFAFDRSMLTGESVPIATSAESDALDTNYLESTCIAMQGTFCVNGEGKGIVVSTGDETIFGTIAKLSSKPKKGLTPLQWEILRFVLLTCGIILTLVVLLCILWGAWLKKSYPDWISVPTLIVDLVSVAVAFMPEGLPIALTTCLIITANQMRRNNILCKSLSIVESLGSLTVLGFDKTGTLTKNQMVVTDVFTDHETMSSDFKGDKLFLTVAAICNQAATAGDKVINGNATDKAVMQFATSKQQLGVFQSHWSKRVELPFNSKDKFMVTFATPASSDAWEFTSVPKHDVNNDSALIMVKGAPDILESKLGFMTQSDGLYPITEDTRDKISRVQARWSRLGKRVLMLAAKVVPDRTVTISNRRLASEQLHGQVRDLIFVGLVAIEDPPRRNIASVIAQLRAARIKIVMITGDFELTGLAIAKSCGIVRAEGSVDTVDALDVDSESRETISITGPQMGQLSDQQWSKICGYDELVFTRTTPQQKLLIIKQFQKNGHLIGMSGDGINDAPSLKQADVGISIAEASDIAKEASDIILMSSDEELFDGIIEALRYGRLVFENLKKTVGYLLPAGTYSELWPVLLNMIFGMPQMLSSFNMILICCITDCINAIVLAFEPSERNLLEKPPRTERLVTWKLLLHSYFTIGTFYSFTSFLLGFLNLQRHGMPFKDFTLSYGTYQTKWENVEEILAMSSSIYFVNLVIMQVINLIAMRTRYLSMFQHPPWLNKYIFVAAPLSFGVTFIINYVPQIQEAMGSSQVPVEYYFISVGFGVVVLVYDELRKMGIRRNPSGFLARIAW